MGPAGILEMEANQEVSQVTIPLLKNTASQKRFFVAETAAGAAITSSVSGSISIDGATAAAASGSFTHIENGVWTYTFTQAETNGDVSITLIPSGGSVKPTQISWDVAGYNDTIEVHPARTWVLVGSRESASAEGVVTVQSTFVGTLAVDYTEWLNPGTEISSVSSPSDTDAALTYENYAVNTQDQRVAVFDITAGLSSGSNYTITVTATTTDGQVLPVQCTLEVE